MRVWMAVIAWAISGVVVAPAAAQQTLSHGRFKDVTLYRPAGEAKGVVLFLSGDGGWNPGVVGMAQALQAEGALVAGISVPALFKDLERDGGDCVFPDGDLENLSHFIQGYAQLKTYHTPVLVGYSSGATLAYAMIAQAPTGTFAGALSLGFCADLELRKPLCRGEGVHFQRRKDGKGADLLPAPTLRVPWIALQGESDQVCLPAATQAFVGQVPGAEMVSLPKVGHGYSVTKNWLPQYLTAYRTLATARTAALPPPPASLGDLPLVEVSPAGAAAATAGDTFAVLLSGDGGWAGLDKDVASALAAQGIPVVGFDSLRYFWTSRTPQGLAADLDRVLRYYAAHWQRSRAVLIGYSQGADVLPFAVNRLPPPAQAMVARTVLMGLSPKASFEFHLGNWVSHDDDGLPILPEALTLDAAKTLCLYGKEEADSLCPKIPPGHVTAEGLAGGHHFDGAYDALAARILAQLPAAH